MHVSWVHSSGYDDEDHDEDGDIMSSNSDHSFFLVFQSQSVLTEIQINFN